MISLKTKNRLIMKFNNNEVILFFINKKNLSLINTPIHFFTFNNK